MVIRTFTGAVNGIAATTVTVEVSITGGGLGLFLVGLPDNAVRESEQRIRSAFENSGFRMTARKCVVNLAPADLRKEGSGFDLPIAVAILAATDQVVAAPLADSYFVGELSLDGSVRGVRGVLPIVAEAKAQGFRKIYVPRENADEAAVVDGIDVLAVESLREVAASLSGEVELEPVRGELQSTLVEAPYADDFADVKGQQHAKRALEIAAAGGHNVIMIGPPGSGKTMLARRMPSILPPMSLDEALETTKIHSVAGKLGAAVGLMSQRPFRAPHHMASPMALIGGGNSPQPGEVSLAHNGVLFLDEMPEFGHSVLEVLRQPLEDKHITISRVRYTVDYPSNFTLVASMNPCPCGYYNHPTKECSCSAAAVHRYVGRISGPLMDRIDLHVEIVPVSREELSSKEEGERSAVVRERVMRARAIQAERFRGTGIYTNTMMSSSMLRRFCPLSEPVRRLLDAAMERLQLSARAYDRIIKVARTIADLAGAAEIEPSHISEAITYRSLDRESWGR
ncbi:MAG: YifB family Mg chelatase-like AAA ATPase [Alistipes sp.]|nr:YifB family Mg chelatase-like AAA ATPase [Alistipes sp.]MBR0332244.1 YifB family Mg chelatase-like AAA ATPase [Alistipes sp.]